MDVDEKRVGGRERHFCHPRHFTRPVAQYSMKCEWAR